MLKNTMTMDVAVIGTDDGKNTFEINRKWKDNGKKSIVIGMYPTITAEKCEMLKTRARSLREESLQMIYGTCFGLRNDETT